MEPFVVKHYSEDERPTIKGNGFDGIEVGEDREEAQGFIDFVNASMTKPPAVLFDGFAVLQALDEKAKARTSAENVSDVLDAVVRLMRSNAAHEPTATDKQGD